MNKLLLNFGLLIFCFAFIFFSQRQMPLHDALLKSFIVFIVLMLVISVLALAIVKALNRTTSMKPTESDELISGKK